MSRAAGRRAEPRSFDELWEALLDVPEGYIGEIVDGEIVETQRPGEPHSMAATDLGTLLGAWFRFGIGGPGGWIFRHEPGIRFGDELRIPDLAGWRTERFVKPTGDGPYLVMPDWILEVLSKGTVREDRTKKMPLYAAHGVPRLWMLDPAAQTLEVYRLQDRAWVLVRALGGDAKARVEPFDAVELDLTLVWGPMRDAGAEP